MVDPERAIAAIVPTRPRSGSPGVRVEELGNGFDFYVSWVGGLCDKETVLSVTRSAPSAEITLRIVKDREIAFCYDVGVLHTLRLTFVEPIRRDQITATLVEPDPRVEPYDAEADD